jgi:iron complex outermembrane receptor protein
MSHPVSIHGQSPVRKAVAAVLGTAIAFGCASPGSAAEEGELVELEEVQVTGSRISRRDLVANSPLVTVEAEAFEERTSLNVESYLNQLPNFNPAAAPTIQTGPGGNSDVQISAVNSVGIAAVSLRGFGPNRNLVLVDGHRPTPINALMVTDINAIPSALIQRVEIISGGASAVYGADAIGGVTNFILRDDFEGVELDAAAGITEVGDGEENRLTAVFGSNIADGRGNVTMVGEFYDRKAAMEAGRPFFENAWADPTVGGDLFLFGYNGYGTGFSPPSPAALDALFGDRPTYTTGPAAGMQTGVLALGPGFVQSLRFNEDGSMFPVVGNNLYRYTGPIDGREFAVQRTYDTTIPIPGVEVETLKWNNLDALASAPQRRYSLFASGHYDINDNLTAFSRASYAQSKTRTVLFPANASFGWETTIPYAQATDSPLDPTLDYSDPATLDAIATAIRAGDYSAYANPGFIPTGTAGAQHPVTPELALLLNSRPDPTAGWMVETYPVRSSPSRSTVNTNTVWQIEAGLRFGLPFGDWTGEAYFSHGESSTYNNAFGNNSLTRQRALLQSPDYGRGVTLSGNSGGASPGFGAADITCASGFYETIFNGDVEPSQDCQDAVGARLQSRTENEQDIAELNLQGGLFDLPAGQLRGAIGLQYRRNAAAFYPDILQSTSSFTDQVIGVYPTAYMDASTNVKDVYGELLVPIVSDLPFAQRVELELGARHSDYADTDSTFTYKISGNWQITDQFRLRGGFNRATRAPNLGELFLNRQEIFVVGGANFGDPCSLRSNAPYGAGGAADDPVMDVDEAPTQLAAGQTAEGAQAAYLICQAQMGTTGATTFYSQNQIGGGGSAFNWILQQGNPELDSEKANTWTAGLVLTSRSANPWLSGLSAAVDWWKVDIKDAIQQYSVDYARYLCYGTEQALAVTDAVSAAAQAASTPCQLVARTAGTGGASTVLIAYDNQATISTSGIDVQTNWFSNFADLGIDAPGGLGVNFQATFLDYYRTKQSPTVFDVETDWEGSLGPTLTGTNAGAYSYRLNLGLSYARGPFGIGLRWRHLPSVWPAAKASQDAVIANNEAVANGGDGILLSYTPGTWIKAKAYNVIDASFSWNINDSLTVRGGVDNLFDWMPRITGGTRGYPAGTDLASVCSAAQEALGCVDPVGPSLASSGRGMTNGGYYDLLGRRFFLGVKLRL